MTYPIRVLHVVGTMDLGGAETFIMNLYRNIDRKKVQFDFLCHNRTEAAYSYEISKLGGKMYKIDGPSHVGFIGYQRQLYHFFLSHPEYNTVHSHQTALNGVILKQAMRAGVPNRYSHSHNAKIKLSVKEKLMLAFFKSYLPNSVTESFACSNSAADYLYSEILRKKTILVPNAIDCEIFRYHDVNKKKILGDSCEDCLIIGHIGRFMNQKNHEFLIDIFFELLKAEPKARLVLIGEGPLLNKIKEKVTNLGIKNKVIFLGKRRDISDLLSSVDLFLFPSLYEGLSVACVEAQAAGLPILTSTNVSSEVCLTELIKQKSLTDSAESWAKETLLLLDENKMEDRKKFADKIMQCGFDSKVTARKMQKIYLGTDNII